jgi:adenosine deaminase
MALTRAFIEKIPKTDLHLHLDGSLRLETLIELAKAQSVDLPSYTTAGLRELVFKDKYQDLVDYLQGFAYTTRVMRDEESLARIACELAEDNQREGVRYIEVRFAPQLHQHKQLSFLAVIQAVNRGLAKARDTFNQSAAVRAGKEPPFAYGIIVCAMRMFDYGFSEYFDTLLDVHSYSERKWIFSLASLELVKGAVEARDTHGIPIVGFDLAGAEKGYPAEDHKQAYELAQKNFLKKTVHAGEAFGPESIFQAITDLHANRIGHGVYLFDTSMIQSGNIKDRQNYVSHLVEYIADRRITIEVCLTSNLQTNPDIRDLKEHSFALMRKAKLSTTFCTDNRTVSQTTVSDEIEKAINAFNIGAHELKNCVIYGFKRSFFPAVYIEKRQYVRQIIEYYEQVEKEFGIHHDSHGPA